MNLYYDATYDLERLQAEIKRLQGIVNALAERVAAQSDALSRAAERDVLARLEVWRKASQIRWWRISPGRVYLRDNTYWVEVVPNPASLPGLLGAIAAGTDDKPATLAECVDFALAKWSELYSEN